VRVSNFFIEKNRLENSGVKQRVILWCLATEIIYEHPMGVGTGDIDFVLMEKYDKYGLLALKDHNLNPHNQFSSDWNRSWNFRNRIFAFYDDLLL
jgi:hypothetical protein